MIWEEHLMKPVIVIDVKGVYKCPFQQNVSSYQSGVNHLELIHFLILMTIASATFSTKSFQMELLPSRKTQRNHSIYMELHRTNLIVQYGKEKAHTSNHLGGHQTFLDQQCPSS